MLLVRFFQDYFLVFDNFHEHQKTQNPQNRLYNLGQAWSENNNQILFYQNQKKMIQKDQASNTN